MTKQTYTIYFDEAGRGPLAWPLYVWLICPIKKLTKKELEPFCDSKQISESQRNQLFQTIQELQQKWKIIYSPARMTSSEIDTYWMTNSLHCAILRGIINIFNQIFPDNQLNNYLPNPISTKIKTNIKYNDILSYFSNLHSKWINIKLIIDWNRDFWLKKSFPFREIQTVISWDATIKEIWMASILAKVSRDYIMQTLPKKYEKYHFELHKWYGTHQHKELLKQYWPSDIHRKLFLKWIYPEHQFKKELPRSF